ncbi:hypothetical protein [Streptomyces sp. NPDC002491]
MTPNTRTSPAPSRNPQHPLITREQPIMSSRNWLGTALGGQQTPSATSGQTASPDDG